MTMYRVGPAGIPASLKTNMDAVLNKKFGTSTTYAPATWPDNVNLLGPLPEKTASGSVASITDGADDVPTKSLVVTIPPTLDGISSISETQTGKNLLNDSLRGANGSNIYFGHDTGTETDFSVRLRAGTYTFSVVTADGTVSNLYMRNSDTNTDISGFPAYNTLSKTFTLAEDTNCAVWVYKGSYSSATDIISAQIEYGSTARSYEPYQTPTVYTASLGRTIYGGQVDIVNGTGTDNCTRVKFSDLNWTYYTGGTNPIFYAQNVPNMKTYARGEIPNIAIDGYTTRFAQSRSYLSTNMANMECSAIEEFQTITFRNTSYTSKDAMLAALGNEYIVYEVATPTDFVFDGQDINTRLGYNAFWSDEGDTEVTYRADINMLIASLSGNRGLMMARPQLEEITEETKEDPEVTEK